MKLVGGRLNIKKIKRQILSQHVAELCKSLPQDAGDVRISWASDMLMGKEKAARENRQKALFCGSIYPWTAWKIFWGKDHCNLSLLSHISSRSCWRHWAGWALSVTWCHRDRCSQHLQLKSPWTQAQCAPQCWVQDPQPEQSPVLRLVTQSRGLGYPGQLFPSRCSQLWQFHSGRLFSDSRGSYMLVLSPALETYFRWSLCCTVGGNLQQVKTERWQNIHTIISMFISRLCPIVGKSNPWRKVT